MKTKEIVKKAMDSLRQATELRTSGIYTEDTVEQIASLEFTAGYNLGRAKEYERGREDLVNELAEKYGIKEGNNARMEKVASGPPTRHKVHSD